MPATIKTEIEKKLGALRDAQQRVIRFQGKETDPLIRSSVYDASVGLGNKIEALIWVLNRIAELETEEQASHGQ